MKGLRANTEAFHALGNLDPPLRGRGELGTPSDLHPSPNPPSQQRPKDSEARMTCGKSQKVDVGTRECGPMKPMCIFFVGPFVSS